MDHVFIIVFGINDIFESNEVAVKTDSDSIQLTESFYPHAFLKKSEGDIVIASTFRPSVMLSPPKPLDEIQPN